MYLLKQSPGASVRSFMTRLASVSLFSSLALSATPADVLPSNFPDPGLFRTSDGTWYAFATRTIGSSIHIPVARSSDWTSWSIITDYSGAQHDALPAIPNWIASPPNTWAPSIAQAADGGFVMYYSASTTQDTSKHCIGAARSTSILGPYAPQQSALICPLAQGGAIDPAGFQDSDGTRYVVYKVDGNSIGHGGVCGNSVAPIVGTPLMLQRLAADGITLQGNPITLLDNQGASDDGVVEAPSLVKIGGTYVLFFSSGCFTDSTYTVSYATSSSLTGPYKRNSTPFLKTSDYGLQSPGGASVWSDGSHVVFHAGKWGDRHMYTMQIRLNGEKVEIAANQQTPMNVVSQAAASVSTTLATTAAAKASATAFADQNAESAMQATTSHISTSSSSSSSSSVSTTSTSSSSSTTSTASVSSSSLTTSASSTPRPTTTIVPIATSSVLTSSQITTSAGTSMRTSSSTSTTRSISTTTTASAAATSTGAAVPQKLSGRSICASVVFSLVSAILFW